MRVWIHERDMRESRKHKMNGLSIGMKKQEKGMEETMHLRQVREREGNDILRWGKEGEGNFRICEDYLLEPRLVEENQREDWKHI
jgi:hypothetical protein